MKRLSPEKLRAQMRKSGWGKVEAFACELGLTKQAIYVWLRGESSPPLNRLFQIAEILKCSIDDLLMEVEDDPEKRTD